MAEQTGQIRHRERLHDISICVLHCAVDSANLIGLHAQKPLVHSVLDYESADICLLMLTNTEDAAESLLLDGVCVVGILLV